MKLYKNAWEYVIVDGAIVDYPKLDLQRGIIEFGCLNVSVFPGAPFNTFESRSYIDQVLLVFLGVSQATFRYFPYELEGNTIINKLPEIRYEIGPFSITQGLSDSFSMEVGLHSPAASCIMTITGLTMDILIPDFADISSKEKEYPLSSRAESMFESLRRIQNRVNSYN